MKAFLFLLVILCLVESTTIITQSGKASEKEKKLAPRKSADIAPKNTAEPNSKAKTRKKSQVTVDPHTAKIKSPKKVTEKSDEKTSKVKSKSQTAILVDTKEKKKKKKGVEDGKEPQRKSKSQTAVLLDDKPKKKKPKSETAVLLDDKPKKKVQSETAVLPEEQPAKEKDLKKEGTTTLEVPKVQEPSKTSTLKPKTRLPKSARNRVAHELPSAKEKKEGEEQKGEKMEVVKEVKEKKAEEVKQPTVQQPPTIVHKEMSIDIKKLHAYLNSRLPDAMYNSLASSLIYTTLAKDPKDWVSGKVLLLVDFEHDKLKSVVGGSVSTSPESLFKSVCSLLTELANGKVPRGCTEPWSPQLAVAMIKEYSHSVNQIQPEYMEMQWAVIIRLLKATDTLDVAALSLMNKPGYYEMLQVMNHRLPIQLHGDMIAEGGFGKVWKGTVGNDVCAVKIINLLKPNLNLFSIVREVQALKLVKGLPNVVQIKRVQMQSPVEVTLALEYLDGVEGFDFLNYHSTLPVDILAAIFRELILGLQSLHGKQVIHADLKWENIYLGVDGQVTIIDLGLAVTKGSYLAGTSDMYAPPEYQDKSKPRIAEPKFDIFMLGMMLFFFLTVTNFDEVDMSDYEKAKAIMDQIILTGFNDIDENEYPEKDMLIEFMRMSMIDQKPLSELLQTPFIQAAMPLSEFRDWLSADIINVKAEVERDKQKQN